MKKVLLIVLISGMFMFSCQENDVGPDGKTGFKYAQEQKNVGFYFSGNWCGPCGLYGKPALENMSSKYGDKFVWFASQQSPDPFNNAVADDFSKAFAVESVPTLFIGSNGDKFQIVTGDSAMESKIDAYLKAGIKKNPLANLAINYIIADGAVNGTAEIEYFEESGLEFTLGLYLIEDKLIERQYVTQTGWVENSTFQNILRTKISANTMGDALPLVRKTKGKIDKVPFSDFVQSNWKKENLHVVAVLWAKQESCEYLAVNATAK